MTGKMIREAVHSVIQNKNSVMFITAVIFMAGILSYFNDCAVPCAAALTTVSIIAVIKNSFSPKYLLFWLFIFYFGFFNSYFKMHSTDALAAFAPADAVIEGQIVTTPKLPKFFFKVNKINGRETKGKTIVTISEPNTDFSRYQIGDFYELHGKLRIPAKASNPSQFDYGNYLRNFDTFTIFYADSSAELDGKLSPKWRFMNNLGSLRNKIIKTHARYIKSPNFEILGGVVFGDDAVVPPPEIKHSFINSGLLHILAASGMNVALIYGFWFFFLSKLRVPYRLTVLSGILLVILYTLMTGLGPSVIRAALMLIIILIGKLIDRSAHSVSLLALVAMLMLIYNPAFINNIGFQMSFIVTFGLLTTGNAVFERINNNAEASGIKIPDWLSGAVLIPVIAQLWIAPIQMFYFNTISAYSVFANILSVPFLSIVSFGGFISSIIAIFTVHIGWIDFVLNYTISAIVFISNFFSSLPNSLVITTHPALFRLFMYYILLASVTLLIKYGRNRKLELASGAIVLLLALSCLSFPDKKLEIITFDVQNADMFLVKTPQNKYFIIDTGKSGYNGGGSKAKLILLPYLRDKGIKNIEGVIVTHFDNDHSGGAVDIMENLKVRRVYLNSYSDKTYTSQQIYSTMKKLGQESELAQNNSLIYQEKDLRLKTFVKTDSEKPAGKPGSDNENSVITLLSYKNFDMIFMGDAGTEAFNSIKNSIPHGIEVFKAGHHGGPKVIDNKMLEHLGSKVSIISTGTNNFGHPNKGTLDILRSTAVYRTDRHNSVKITTDGNIYTIFTYDKKKYFKSKEFSARE
ncbi:MAG: DNA internalization-related competence protein ComEC/Rec2 [Heliobacteriaceae bacterium]|jgi:competence protein ComEC|nr:DNA internalization-related competence protein ComEC/Rec2 [Heliobacteriaceae bacterium]